MSFAMLALILGIGLLGPLLGWRPGWHIPVLLGELLGGIIFGRTGFGILEPDDPTFSFLADMGFALVMFVAGSHVPIRDAAVRSALGRGGIRAALVGVFGAIAGTGLAAAFDTGHGAIYAVLIASSSAALVLPVIDSFGLSGRPTLELTAQVAIADTVCVVALPLVIDTRHALRAAVGALAVGVCALALYYVLHRLERTSSRRRIAKVSAARDFAVELRANLVMVFGLAAVATATHVSIMLAGFAAGLVVSALGEPRRVARQLFAITDGFLAPLFFVWLGARIDLREFVDHPSSILLGLTLGGAAILAHLATRLIGQPLPYAALAAAQLGVPVAAVTTGSQLGVLVPGEAAAILLGALITIGGVVVAGRWLGPDRTGPKPTP